ncbi:5505_t:CDS:1, partial [Acaulospora colombiana]
MPPAAYLLFMQVSPIFGTGTRAWLLCRPSPSSRTTEPTFEQIQIQFWIDGYRRHQAAHSLSGQHQVSKTQETIRERSGGNAFTTRMLAVCLFV